MKNFSFFSSDECNDINLLPQFEYYWCNMSETQITIQFRYRHESGKTKTITMHKTILFLR